MSRISLFLLVSLLNSCPQHQNGENFDPILIGGPCEGCEAVFEFGQKIPSSHDTLPGFESKGLPIKVSGTVYFLDGKTPAPNIILYLYHTNQAGVYPTKGTETGWERRHGYLRGWLKTDEKGHYSFVTRKPAPYPDRSNPAHIHLTLLEPDGKYYWVDSYLFAGDSLLSEEELSPEAPRGGSSGVLTLNQQDDIWTGTRNLILGKNIPGYP